MAAGKARRCARAHGGPRAMRRHAPRRARSPTKRTTKQGLKPFFEPSQQLQRFERCQAIDVE
jgi:hypothetical protein